MAQALAEALDTPIEVIWPPEDNAHVDHALRALREQRANDAAEARFAEPSTTPDLWDPAPPEAAVVPSPAPSVPDPRDIVRTLDGHDLPSRSPGRRPGRRVLVPVVASLAVALAAGTALATAGGEDPPPTQAGVSTGPTAIERERAAQRVALVQAREREDYNAAITIATSIGDGDATAELKAAAGETLARRARAAAERGDLALASSRLDRAEDRYGRTPTMGAVERRIDAIKQARTERAAKRRAAAKKRAAARARAAAAAAARQRAAPSRAASPTPQPVTPAPSPTPTPSPTPAPSSGGSGGSSKPKNDGGSDKTVDPGIF